jgi:hypothetical protein
VQLERLGQLKIPVTSLGIEPATFRIVAQCLSQLRYRVPPALIFYHYQMDKLKTAMSPSYIPQHLALCSQGIIRSIYIRPALTTAHFDFECFKDLQLDLIA